MALVSKKSVDAYHTDTAPSRGRTVAPFCGTKSKLNQSVIPYLKVISSLSFDKIQGVMFVLTPEIAFKVSGYLRIVRSVFAIELVKSALYPSARTGAYTAAPRGTHHNEIRITATALRGGTQCRVLLA